MRAGKTRECGGVLTTKWQKHRILWKPVRWQWRLRRRTYIHPPLHLVTLAWLSYFEWFDHWLLCLRELEFAIGYEAFVSHFADKVLSLHWDLSATFDTGTRTGTGTETPCLSSDQVLDHFSWLSQEKADKIMAAVKPTSCILDLCSTCDDGVQTIYKRLSTCCYHQGPF